MGKIQNLIFSALFYILTHSPAGGFWKKFTELTLNQKRSIAKLPNHCAPLIVTLFDILVLSPLDRLQRSPKE